MLRAQRGDGRAFEELVRPHQEIAFRVAYLITGSEADAADASQDGLVKAWRGLGRFNSGRPLRPWLLAIVANEARNRRRSTARRTALVLRVQREGVSGDAASSPEADVVAADERRRLLAAVDALPDGVAARRRLPLPARAHRGGDGGRARPAPRHGQVADVARARAPEGEL